MLAIQYDLFEERPSEVEELRIAVQSYKESMDKQRKKQFALIGDITKRMMDVEGRMQAIERGLCHGK
jgi:hypothetical protein